MPESTHFVVILLLSALLRILLCKSSRKPYRINRVICENLGRWKFALNKVYIEDKKKLLRKLNWIHSRYPLDFFLHAFFFFFLIEPQLY